MCIARHCCIYIISRASALVQNLLSTLLFIASSTTLLHISRSVPRNVCIVRESATELRLVAVSLASSRVLILLICLVLSIRLLIIQYLNILIIIIIISFLALRLESSSHRHPRQPVVLPLIRVRARARRAIDVVVGAGCLTGS